uniref:RxLR effector candidate protein n=1 Tax=Hyaloperonospora arabidopsidis (strain Emoy2) TaxID=559515 RepID=M4BPK8_HYAAE
MVKCIGLVAAVSAAIFVGVISASNNGDQTASISGKVRPAENDDVTSDNTKELTVDNACVLANFKTSAADFIGLNNLLSIVKASPSLLSPYVSDPLIIEDVALAPLNYSYLGYNLQVTPMFNWMNVSGITTIAPYPVNVTSSNTLNLGAEFTGTVALQGTMTFAVALPKREWYQLCVVDLLHPSECKPQLVTVHMSISVEKPRIMTNMQANLYECAPSIPESACQNLTTSTIMVDALGGNISAVYSSIYKNFKDAKINKLKLDWEEITQNDISYVVHDMNEFVSKFLTDMLGTETERLNEKGEYYHDYIKVVQTILLSLMDKTVDSSLEPQFGATCL